MKRSSPELRPTKWDALVVLTVLVLALALMARPFLRSEEEQARTVVVSIDGEEIERAAFDAFCASEHNYTGRGYTLRVAAVDGGIAVIDSDCPNRDCVHSGAIVRAGQSIVCLPGRIAIVIEGAAADYDVIAG